MLLWRMKPNNSIWTLTSISVKESLPGESGQRPGAVPAQPVIRRAMGPAQSLSTHPPLSRMERATSSRHPDKYPDKSIPSRQSEHSQRHPGNRPGSTVSQGDPAKSRAPGQGEFHGIFPAPLHRRRICPATLSRQAPPPATEIFADRKRQDGI